MSRRYLSYYFLDNFVGKHDNRACSAYDLCTGETHKERENHNEKRRPETD